MDQNPNQNQAQEPSLQDHRIGSELGQGASQDILSGRPNEQVTKEQADQANEVLEAKVQQANWFENELHGSTGSQIMDKIETCFEVRLQEIANADPECLAYRKILRSLQYEITVGRYVKREVGKLKKKEEVELPL